jgi:hypothetical protein
MRTNQATLSSPQKQTNWATVADGKGTATGILDGAVRTDQGGGSNNNNKNHDRSEEKMGLAATTNISPPPFGKKPRISSS